MENFLIYLLKASTGIMLFYLFYYLVLRKETFYVSNRLYLIAGLVLAVLLPAFPVSYTTPMSLINNSDLFTINENPIGDFSVSNTGEIESLSFWKSPALILSSIYLLGAGLFLLRLVLQTAFVTIQLRQGKRMLIDEVIVIDIKRKIMPFSFFNAVVININEYSTEDLSNVIAHEKVHIQERHWVDLLIIELLTVVFWINPIVWLYEKSIKQNHEYLADQGVLLAGYHPGQYRALLINQLMGVKILGLTNNLNSSLNKKRMEMMKKDKSPRFKKVKLLIALPVVAVLIFAFAKPELVMVDGVDVTIHVQQTIDEHEMIPVKGTVTNKDGIPLTGANVVLKNTMQGTVVDRQGEFEIDIPRDGTLVVSFIGYKTVATSVNSKEEAKSFVSLKMEKGVFNIELPDVSEGNVKMQAPPPPPPKISEADKDKVFMIVEEMPYYSNGGMTRLALDIQNETESILSKTKDRGEVLVGFTVTEDGRVRNTHLVKGSNSDILNQSALQVVKKLDQWNPGKQRAKRVDVDLTVSIKF